MLTLTGHRNMVRGLSFSPDDWRLASTSHDQTVRVWEAAAVPEDVWRKRWVVGQVNDLYKELGLRQEVLASLHKYTTLNKCDREFAFQVARTHPENFAQLSQVVWKVVMTRDAGKDAYDLAIRQAQAAINLKPQDGYLLKTLGVAQYRAGRYTDAMETLTKSAKLNGSKQRSDRTELAFLSMTQHQLGKTDDAKATLARLRDVMKHTRGWDAT
jgi:tetratricopeptide (TPR) repeat protein